MIKETIVIKVHIFREGQKILRNLHLTVHTVKSKVTISQYFVAFSEYMNFIAEIQTSFISSLVIGLMVTFRCMEPNVFFFLFFFIRSSLLASVNGNRKSSVLQRKIKNTDCRPKNNQKSFGQRQKTNSEYFIQSQFILFISLFLFANNQKKYDVLKNRNSFFVKIMW